MPDVRSQNFHRAQSFIIGIEVLVDEQCLGTLSILRQITIENHAVSVAELIGHIVDLKATSAAVFGIIAADSGAFCELHFSSVDFKSIFHNSFSFLRGLAAPLGFIRSPLRRNLSIICHLLSTVRMPSVLSRWLSKRDDDAFAVPDVL